MGYVSVTLHKKCEKSKVPNNVSYSSQTCRFVFFDLNELPFHEVSYFEDIEDIDNQIDITRIENTSDLGNR